MRAPRDWASQEREDGEVVKRKALQASLEGQRHQDRLGSSQRKALGVEETLGSAEAVRSQDGTPWVVLTGWWPDPVR